MVTVSFSTSTQQALERDLTSAVKSNNASLYR